jgi:sortase A
MVRGLLCTLVLGLSLSGCSAGGGDADRAPARQTPSGLPGPTGPPTSDPAPAPVVPRVPEAPDLSSDGQARESRLSIPAIDVADLRVVPYRGSPDDAPGTRIQNGGVAASPGGPDGGVGPGGVGNHIVTAHRTSSTRAFADLPRLQRGDRVHVEVGARRARVRYTYEIVRTRSTSFRSSASLREQSAPVPGRPGRPATRAMITLSTCATPEDHAAGNYWSDEFGNPEHRIDKIGVLVARTSR